jgi:magnesium chelatase family protein
MKSKDLKVFCVLSPECAALLKQAVLKLNLSARSYHRTIKLSRTIADLEGSDVIQTSHIAEALQYRPRTTSL